MTDHAVLATPAPDFTVDQAEDIARRHFAIAAVASPLASERDQNFRLRADDGRQYVLKIANPAERREVLAFQTAALRHVATTAPSLPVPAVRPGIDDDDLHQVEQHGQRYLVRVVTYLPGVLLDDGASSPALRRSIGGILARLDIALRGFFHPAAGHELLWDLNQAPQLVALLDHVDKAERPLLAGVLEGFRARVAPVLPSLRGQVIHNDFNRGNLVVAPDDPHRICGIIDFGDMVYGPRINDLAIAVAYQTIEAQADIAEAVDVVSAYHAVAPVSSDEIGLLYDLIATRMVQSLVISAWRAGMHPQNARYILADRPVFLAALERWLDHGPDAVSDALRTACGLTTGATTLTGPDDDERLRQRRRQLLGPALRLSYKEPLHLVRGDGVWLYDRRGRRFLDAYNNVASVGHCHPAVVAALARQSATLNTNTRYLHGTIVEYAEQLAATLPGELSVCMFVCSGTEANDLAWQIAQACTGGDGAIVTDNAYHGNSTAVSLMSPEELAPELRADWVATVPAPNGYTGPYRAGTPETGERYAACLDTAIGRLRHEGHRLAAFIVDTIYSSDGIIVAPDDYLARAWGRVRDAGGLCIADEVQAGFGRTGDHLWGFEQQGVVPDIVTLGKPIGNGHPLAAVVTTPEIAERFARSRYYFNTFGGNPVSCAVGLTVLEVLRRERLPENARDVGAYLRTRVETLAERHGIIGDVRGAGLMLGVELVRDRATRAPATDAAVAAVDAMRERGVLIGRTGLAGQVLKIRPPLVFSRANADQLIEALDATLAALPRDE